MTQAANEVAAVLEGDMPSSIELLDTGYAAAVAWPVLTARGAAYSAVVGSRQIGCFHAFRRWPTTLLPVANQAAAENHGLHARLIP